MTKARLASLPIELLIVLPVIAILAGMVALQVASASTDAREALLTNDLTAVRTAICKYSRDHLGSHPEGQLFASQLCRRTDASGAVMPDGADISDFPFGPYLDGLPANTYIENLASASAVKTGSSECPSDGTSGWYYNEQTGLFSANNLRP